MTSDLHRIYLVKKLLNMYFAHKKAQYGESGGWSLN